MKVAIMCSGLPRFSENFSLFVQNLKNYNRIDWFFHLWKSDHLYDNKISPAWKNDVSQIYKTLVQHLPPNNFVVSMNIVDMPVFDVNKHLNIFPTANPKTVWIMYNGIKQVNDIRENYEKVFGEYDLVIRHRVDGNIDKTIFLDRAKEYLNSHTSKVLIMPSNGRLGFVPVGYPHNVANDNFAIGESKIMSTYATVFDNIDLYTQEGIPMTAESMLGWHLLKCGISTPMSDFEYYFDNKSFLSWL